MNEFSRLWFTCLIQNRCQIPKAKGRGCSEIWSTSKPHNYLLSQVQGHQQTVTEGPPSVSVSISSLIGSPGTLICWESPRPRAVGFNTSGEDMRMHSLLQSLQSHTHVLEPSTPRDSGLQEAFVLLLQLCHFAHRETWGLRG